MNIDKIQKNARPLLTVLSWGYLIVTRVRNFLYNNGILSSRSFAMPVISVGNLSVGGTGKTPHSEYLCDLLERKGKKVGMLSRGYMRSTRGYVLASSSSTAQQIGDEPLQFKMMYPETAVAVDERRAEGIERMMRLEDPRLDVILLDDAYQHRKVQPGLSILLTDYSRLFTEDRLLPAGLLREEASESRRAQIVIVTKCPSTLKPIDFNIATKRVHVFPFQKLYFTSFRYKAIRPLFEEGKQTRLKEKTAILLLTGIHNPQPLKEHVSTYCQHLELISFGDHHNFTREDFRTIRERFERLPSKDRMIVTTTKDAARIATSPHLPGELRPYLFVQGIEVKFLLGQQEMFNQQILDYVKKDSRSR